MTRNLQSLLKSALFAAAMSLTLLATPARAQVVIVTPPDECIATFSPVYYNGYASYWCGNSWYYRGRGGWGVYANEPGFLFSYRGNHGWGGRYYGRGRPYGGARAGIGRELGRPARRRRPGRTWTPLTRFDGVARLG